MTVREELVFDVGMHHGEDTGFYLGKGFSVVAVEAVPEFCERVSAERADAIRAGRLVVENVAVVERPGPVEFFTSSASVLGTVRPEFVERNRMLGIETGDVIQAAGVTLRSLVEAHGVPYYLKIDIEGADLAALRSLEGAALVPPFLSMEAEKFSWRLLRDELRTLRRLGYDRFQIVNQQFITDLAPADPPREGTSVGPAFASGSSGSFGRELPGRWMTYRQTVLRFAAIFLRYKVNGDQGLVWRLKGSSLWFRASRRLLGEAAWFDTHATTAAELSHRPPSRGPDQDPE